MDFPSVPKALFRIGRIVATPNALSRITDEDVLCAIQRHQAGDWGNLSAEDLQTNDVAMKNGQRLLSAYKALNGTRFWIITEADRSVTTVLLPEDY